MFDQVIVPMIPDKDFRILSATGCPGRYTRAGYYTDPLVEDCTLVVKFDADIVDPIADPALKAAVKSALYMEDDEVLTAQKMWLLREVNLGNNPGTKNVFSLQGLQYAKNLIVLTIYNWPESKVSNTSTFDLSPLKELTYLQTLSVMNVHIKDLSPISVLENLNFLAIRGGDVTDISPISSLKI